MKTQTIDIAKIISTAIWADGVFAEEEKVAVEQVAEALELGEGFAAEVEAQVAAMAELDEEAANAILAEACENVDDEDVATIIEAVLQVLVCDGKLSRDEVNTLLAITEELGADTADAILLLCDLVKEEQDVDIDLM